MRADKNYPFRIYENFLDWALTDLRHTALLISLIFAYLYYLMTTEEV